MQRKSLALLLVISFLAGSLTIVYFLNRELHRKKLAEQKIETLSNLPLFDLDSTRSYPKPGRKTILIYFDSGCDYCQNEINALIINIDAFKHLDIVLVSSELISAIKFYAQKNGQLQRDNIRLMQITMEEADKTFGSLAVPQIFIYGADGSLVKKFKGETSIGTLLQYT